MLRAVFGLALMITLGGAAQADPLIVIAATNAGERYQPGTQIDTADAVELAAGGRLTLMSQAGAIIKLDGPHSGPAAASGAASGSDWPDGMKRVAGLVSTETGATNVLGASRKPDGTTGIAAQPDLWLLNTDSSGERCIQSGKLGLWRREADRDADVVVRGERERLPKAVWPSGAHLLELPDRLAQDGDRLVLSVNRKPRRYTLHVLPEAIDAKDHGALLRWMIDKDCKRQAILLIDAIHAGSASN